MVYVAVPAVAPVVEMVWLIVFPVPVVAPVTPFCETVHEKVAPVGELLRLMFACVPLQIVCVEGCAVADGRGFIVTVAEEGVPWHPFAVG